MLMLVVSVVGLLMPVVWLVMLLAWRVVVWLMGWAIVRRMVIEGVFEYCVSVFNLYTD